MIVKDIKTEDQILHELWETKDYYSNSCNNDFKKLAEKLKKDAKNLVKNKKIVNLHK